MTQPDLERLFSSCGNIITSRILCDNITGVNNGDVREQPKQQRKSDSPSRRLSRPSSCKEGSGRRSSSSFKVQVFSVGRRPSCGRFSPLWDGCYQRVWVVHLCVQSCA